MSALPLTATALRCPGCGADFEPHDVNEGLELASCRRCEKVLDLAAPRGSPRLPDARASLLTAGPAAPAPAPALAPVALRARVPLPEGMRALERPGSLQVTFAPSLTRRVWAVLSVVGVAAYAFFRLVQEDLVDAPWVAPAAVAYALGGAWVVAAALVNRVRVTAANKSLTVRTGPVPWFGNRRVSPGQVQQLFVEARPTPDRTGAITSCSYVLSAVVGPEGRRLELVDQLTQADQALWLEQTLERALGVRHVPVGGELDQP